MPKTLLRVMACVAALSLVVEPSLAREFNSIPPFPSFRVIARPSLFVEQAFALPDLTSNQPIAGGSIPRAEEMRLAARSVKMDAPLDVRRTNRQESYDQAVGAVKRRISDRSLTRWDSTYFDSGETLQKALMRRLRELEESAERYKSLAPWPADLRRIVLHLLSYALCRPESVRIGNIFVSHLTNLSPAPDRPVFGLRDDHAVILAGSPTQLRGVAQKRYLDQCLEVLFQELSETVDILGFGRPLSHTEAATAMGLVTGRVVSFTLGRKLSALRKGKDWNLVIALAREDWFGTHAPLIHPRLQEAARMLVSAVANGHSVLSQVMRLARIHRGARLKNALEGLTPNTLYLFGRRPAFDANGQLLGTQTLLPDDVRRTMQQPMIIPGSDKNGRGVIVENRTKSPPQEVVDTLGNALYRLLRNDPRGYSCFVHYTRGVILSSDEASSWRASEGGWTILRWPPQSPLALLPEHSWSGDEADELATSLSRSGDYHQWAVQYMDPYRPLLGIDLLDPFFIFRRVQFQSSIDPSARTFGAEDPYSVLAGIRSDVAAMRYYLTRLDLTEEHSPEYFGIHVLLTALAKRIHNKLEIFTSPAARAALTSQGVEMLKIFRTELDSHVKHQNVRTLSIGNSKPAKPAIEVALPVPPQRGEHRPLSNGLPVVTHSASVAEHSAEDLSLSPESEATIFDILKLFFEHAGNDWLTVKTIREMSSACVVYPTLYPNLVNLALAGVLIRRPKGEGKGLAYKLSDKIYAHRETYWGKISALHLIHHRSIVRNDSLWEGLIRAVANVAKRLAGEEVQEPEPEKTYDLASGFHPDAPLEGSFTLLAAIRVSLERDQNDEFSAREIFGSFRFRHINDVARGLSVMTSLGLLDVRPPSKGNSRIFILKERVFQHRGLYREELLKVPGLERLTASAGSRTWNLLMDAKNRVDSRLNGGAGGSDENVSFGTICELDHREAQDGLNEQLRQEFSRLRHTLGRQDNAPLTEKEVDDAYGQDWSPVRERYRQFLTDHPYKGRLLPMPQIFFVDPPGGGFFWWVGDRYAAAHYDRDANRIFISRRLARHIIKSSWHMIDWYSSRLNAMAYHETLHIAGLTHREASEAHHLVDPGVDAFINNLVYLKKVGDRAEDIRQLRKKSQEGDYSVKAVADQAQITPRTYYNFLNGAFAIQTNIILAIADVLGVPLWLLTDVDLPLPDRLEGRFKNMEVNELLGRIRDLRKRRGATLRQTAIRGRLGYASLTHQVRAGMLLSTLSGFQRGLGITWRKLLDGSIPVQVIVPGAQRSSGPHQKSMAGKMGRRLFRVRSYFQRTKDHGSYMAKTLASRTQGVSYKTYLALESGERSALVKSWLAAADELGIPIWHIFEVDRPLPQSFKGNFKNISERELHIRIRHWVKLRGLSLEEFADQAGLSVKTLLSNGGFSFDSLAGIRNASGLLWRQLFDATLRLESIVLPVQMPLNPVEETRDTTSASS